MPERTFPNDTRTGVVRRNKTASSHENEDSSFSSSHGSHNDHQSAQPTHRPRIPVYQGHAYADRSYDYIRKYPPDSQGKELDPDARIWKVYLDESESYDNDMVKAFRDTIDAMLVFAALFSSVVSTFIGESIQSLEPDYAQINTNLLFEQNQLLRAAGNASKIEAVPKSTLGPDSVTHSSSDIYANWMFFASLSVSLAAALLSVLIKQWLQEFTSVVSGDARQRSLVRQFRFGGLRRWKLSEIINILPVFLHLSLMLFLIGLCIFVEEFHKSIFAVVCFVTAASFVFYIITAALPAVYLDCPYRLAILYLPACFVIHVFRELRFAILRRGSRFPFPTAHWRSQELQFVLTLRKRLEASCVAWLFEQSTNASVQKVSFDTAASILEPSVDTPLFYSEEDKELGQVLPLTQLCSYALRLAEFPTFHLENAEPSLDFLTNACYMDPTSLPPDAWHAAIHSMDLLTTFLRCGVPINVKYSTNHFHGYPIDHASRLDKWDVVMRLFLHSPLSHITGFGSAASPTVLGRACVSKSISHEDWVNLMELSRRRGINLSEYTADQNGSSIWHLVCRQGNTAAVQYLTEITPKLDCNVRDHSDSTPLHSALSPDYRVNDGRVPIVKMLLAHGANVAATDCRGNSGLHFACFARSLSIPLLQEITSHIPDTIADEVVNHPTPDGATPLHTACRVSPPPAIDILLSSNANPNAQDRGGWIPLHDACNNVHLFESTEDVRTFERLVNATADINIISKEGETPMDLLILNKMDSDVWTRMYEVMRQKGAKCSKVSSHFI